MSDKTLFYTDMPCYTVFFDQNKKLITYVHENDGDFRHEYFAPLLEHFGVEVKYFDLPRDVYETIDNHICSMDEDELIEKYVKPCLEDIIKK